MNRIRNIGIAAGVLLLVIVIFFTLRAVTKKPQKAHDFTVGTQSGKVISLSDNFKKRGTVVIFIDPEVEGSTLLLSRIIKANGGADVIALSVSSLSESEQRQKLTDDILELDGLCFECTDAIEKYNIGAAPVTYFVDADGYVKDAFIGAMSDKSIEKSLKKIE